jgi:hypothetical protein
MGRHDLESVETARRRAASIAREVLDGRQPILAAAVLIARLRDDADIPADDPDFTAFVLIASETDHLPLGAERQYWAEEALREKDREIARADRARGFGLEACRNLVSRFDVGHAAG